MDYYTTEASNTYTCRSTHTSQVQSTNYNEVYYQSNQQNQEYFSRSVLLSQPCEYQSSSKGPASTETKAKRKRIALNAIQQNKLEVTFRDRQYLNKDSRHKLAQQLKLSEQQVKIWFQNRRMKYKKQIIQRAVGREVHQNVRSSPLEKSHKETVKRLMAYSFANS